MSLKIKEIEAKSIIGTTQVPSADYVINPYTGCQFACMYCFASFMGRFVGETNNNWGNYVYVKTNAIELMEKDIKRLMKKNPHPRVVLSTVTDPYQGVEKKYRLTRGILEVFVKNNYQGRVGILTKSPMVLDDLELLKKIPNLEVGLSITTTDDKLSRFLEVQAPLASARLRTLKKLNDAGIKTYVFVGPFLPHMKLKPELIDKLFSEIKVAGTYDVKIEYLNLPKYVRPKMNKMLKEESEDIQEVYSTSQLKKYREEIEPILRDALEKYGLKLKFDEIVHHVGKQKLVEN
ncbi:MAG: SPL family radical SAM protein [Polaribacter sp.]